MTQDSTNTIIEPRPSPRRRGFTLIELLVVMTIIGIIITLILVVSRDSLRQAEMRATQALILKLETGINDRIDALLQYRPEPNFSHGYLAGIYPGGKDPFDGGPAMVPPAILSTGHPDTRVRTTGRAQAFALADYLKSEMPDVFAVQTIPTAATENVYPLNFAGVPFPGDAIAPLGNHMLPLGHMVQGPRNGGAWDTGYGDSHTDPSTGFFVSSHPQLGPSGSGIYGASYSVAAGVYKNLGYLPAGYDMIDNDGDGLIDEWDEGVNAQNLVDVQARLGLHTHDTARSEMLYALLVEGQGPLGSIFNRDDFTDREVRDTDGDGLPEFIDAWGKPLQFFRWPVLYHSDAQRGQNVGPDMTDAAVLKLLRPYTSMWETREQDPLDPNQQLQSPAWWLGTSNVDYPLGSANALGGSGGVVAFEQFFHRITEPMAYAGSNTDLSKYWDRGGATGLGARRAFFSKPLILSGGPDQLPGVFLFPNGTSLTATDLIGVENNAAQFVPSEVFSGATIPAANFNVSGQPLSFELMELGKDDITNHNVISTGGIGGS